MKKRLVNFNSRFFMACFSGFTILFPKDKMLTLTCLHGY